MHHKKIFSQLLVLVSVAAGVFFRLYPRVLPFYDVVAKQEVYSKEFSDIQKNVRIRYPHLYTGIENKMAHTLFKKQLKDQRKGVREEIARRSHELKNQFRNEEGHLYLSGVDSYHWFRLLRNLLDHGHIGDRIVDGMQYDDLIAASIDRATSKNVHIWLGFIFYKLACLFSKDIPLPDVLFYVPVVLSVIIALFSFYVARRLGADELGAFFASVAINLSPFFIMRSVSEWFDTDIYNVLFPLLVFGAFVFAFTHKKLSGRIFLSALSAIFLACYASTWKGWWFIFDIMILACLLFILNQKLSQEDTGVDDSVIKNHLTALGFFFIFSTLCVIIVNGFSVWKDFIVEPLRLSMILKITPESMWPNVFWTVAELERANLLEVVDSLGGYFIFFSALVGLIYIALVEHGLRDDRLGFGLLCLMVWILSVFLSAVEVLRLILLLVVPFGLAFGVTITKIYGIFEKLTQRHLKKGWIARSIVVFIFAMPVASNILSIHTKLVSPLIQVDDHWHAVLTKIEKETPKDTIVNSWWDFGHWFKAIANRRVLFDGMTQNTPYAYWVANVLLTDKEEKAVGILRMVNASDNKAVDILQQRTGLDLAGAVEIIKEACGMNKKEAALYLSKHLAPELIEEVLKYLFPENLPPVYFIVSYDMPIKIGAISYIGNWDFKKVDMWFKIKKTRFLKDDFVSYAMARYGLSREEAEVRFLEVSLLNDREAKRWFSQLWGFSSDLSPSETKDGLVFFANGLVVNLVNHSAYVVSEETQKRGKPQSLLFMENGQLKEELQKDSNLSISALLIKEGQDYKSILLPADFAKSMLARLYYLKGEGLKSFKLYHREEDEKGNAIYVYKVIWEK